MRTRVLGGSDGSQGLEVELRLTTTVGVNDGAEARAAQQSRAFRAVPLLRVVGRGPERVLVVGQARVVVGTSAVVVELAVQAAWAEASQWGPLDAASVSLQLLETALRSPGHDVGRVVRSEPGRQLVASRLAKGLAEGSRNSVADVRAIRYELEQALAEGLRGKRGRTGLLAQIVEIALAVNRARDQAREAAREGMWLWFTDDEAYQRHRHSLDPTLLNGVEPADAGTRPWMRQHDAGYRQCAGMEALLGEEARLLYDLLGGASTVEASREADAQETLNTLLTVAGVGLGVPALLLTLYGVDGLTPATNVRSLAALLFIAAITTLAAVGPNVLSRRERRLLRRYRELQPAVRVLLPVLAFVVVLILAGLVAPPGSETG